MMQRFDAIVIGLGGMGGAALYHLARRGCKVLGIDPFGPPHDHGSSHGGTRIIRKAYFEHPAYVPLVHRAYELWAELEAAAGATLVHRTGLLLMGAADGTVIRGVQRAAQTHKLDIQELSLKDVRKQFPGFAPSDEMSALFEADAGYLAVEDCVRVHVEQARAEGATLQIGDRVTRWSARSDGVVVQTSGDTHRADHLVICPGAWAGTLLADLHLPLCVRRKVVFWVDAADGPYSVRDGWPTFCFDTREGFFYGFPIVDQDGMKVAEHTGGDIVNDAASIDRVVHDADFKPVSSFIDRYLPAATTQIRKHAVCMYTMTPDDHFIVDRHPAYDNVYIAAGFSGHGFKFAPVIGSALADLVTTGRTHEPIEFLKAKRPGLMNTPG